MFALRPQATTNDKNATCYAPNILPCRIHHDGPIENLNRYWAPETDEKGLQTAYFRGRKLRGRRVVIPEGYQGVVAATTDRILPTSRKETSTTALHDVDTEPQAEEEEPVRVLEEEAVFQEFMVWGHETIPAPDDAYVKGIEEWIKFAEVMHCGPRQSDDRQQTSAT